MSKEAKQTLKKREIIFFWWVWEKGRGREGGKQICKPLDGQPYTYIHITTGLGKHGPNYRYQKVY